MKVWKDDTIEDTIIVFRNSHENHQAQNKLPWGRNCLDFGYDFLGFMSEPIREIMKEIMDMAKRRRRRERRKRKLRSEGFQDLDLEEIQSEWTPRQGN